MVLETPRSFDPNKSIPEIQDLMSSTSFNDVRIVWEIRWGPPGDKLIRLMQDFNIVHSVDLSRESNPAFGSDILYSRLFGHGWKVIDISRDHRVYAKVLLEKLADSKYESIGDVINNLRL